MSLSILGFVLALPAASLGQGGDAPTNAAATAGIRQRHLSRVQACLAEDRQRYGGDTNMLVRPGLLADRTSQWVRIYAETVGVNPFITPQVEFPLIAEGSGKDYEALAVAFAQPSDIHAALVFIGVPPGRAVDYAKQQFWPKGERVLMTFEWQGTNAAAQSRRAEDLVLDTRTGKPLPPLGFVFVGSRWVAPPDNPTQKAYAADIFEPMAIASVYNEADTVLDVPRRAGKSDMYNDQVRNPDAALPKAELIRVRLEPERKDHQRRVLDLGLRIASVSTNPAAALKDLQFVLTDAEGQARQTGHDVKSMLAAFERCTAAGRDLFVALRPDAALTLAALREAYLFMASLENDNGIRVEPPPPGQPYYKAFLPNESFRERANRPVQPLELYLAEHHGAVTGQLQQVEETGDENATNAAYKVTRFDVPTPNALAGLLRERKYPSVVLVFAPPTLTYGALLPFTEKAQATHPTVYVFLDPLAK
jgi:hypothetical protein